MQLIFSQIIIASVCASKIWPDVWPMPESGPLYIFTFILSGIIILGQILDMAVENYNAR